MEKIVDRLEQAYGRPTLVKRNTPIDEFILTILSQNTNDKNRDRAFLRLKERFPTWEAVKNADVALIEEAIRPGGLAQTKAPRIKAALYAIQKCCGELSLDMLEQKSAEDAFAFLTSLEGVGPKTAACVLLFAFEKPVFPVDTHIWRIAKRLGVVEEKTSAQETQHIMQKLFAPEDYYSLHLNLIFHGRRVCHARRPNCFGCVLADVCRYHLKEHADV